MTSMYDSTQPSLIPATAEYIAIYGNGQYAASRETVQRQFPKARIFSIDVLNADAVGCGIADVENGDMTPADVPGWVDRRLAAHHNGVLCRIYCNQSTWPAVKAEVAKLAPEKRAAVRYWIADPTGNAHSLPGADATQYYWAGDWDQSTIDTARFVTG
jgi:hypothetical protein